MNEARGLILLSEKEAGTQDLTAKGVPTFKITGTITPLDPEASRKDTEALPPGGFQNSQPPMQWCDQPMAREKQSWPVEPD